jgi:2-methylcitrate dehydratase PrpD
MTIAERLGKYSATLDYGALPDNVIECAKLKILDTFACAVAASRTETARVLEHSYAHSAPEGPAGLWGMGRGSSPLDAAFGNAVLAHALLHDDTDLEAGHVACQVVPAVIAAAGDLRGQRAPLDGRDIICAVVAGYEVMWRGSACGGVVKGSLERSFRGFIINGALGAASAAARMFKLDANGHRAAISCAANAVSGLLEPVGVASIERSVMAGNNARAGLHAAILARGGLKGTPSILEGPQGYFQAVGGSASLASERLLAGLGEHHRIVDTLYKMYPSAGANQSAIYAADVIYHRHHPPVDTIRAINVLQYPLFGGAVRMSSGKPAYPSILSTGPYFDLEETLPNKPFGVAAMLLFGHHDFPAIMEGLNNAELRVIAEKVRSDGDNGFTPFDASIEIVMANGQQIRERVDCATEPRFFPTMQSMAERFRMMCGAVINEAEISGLIQVVAELDRPEGASRLLDFMDSIGSITSRHDARVKRP